MQIAPIPGNEQARIQTLLRYEILDTEPESAYDDFVKLASYICQPPIALISLVDPTRQWFKAQVGCPTTEASRDIALCAHAIHQSDVLVVPDTLIDPRFVDNPLVTRVFDFMPVRLSSLKKDWPLGHYVPLIVNYGSYLRNKYLRCKH